VDYHTPLYSSLNMCNFTAGCLGMGWVGRSPGMYKMVLVVAYVLNEPGCLCLRKEGVALSVYIGTDTK
jgi:hypothetical protein